MRYVDGVKVVSALYCASDDGPDRLIALLAWRVLDGEYKYRVVMSHADKTEEDRPSYLGHIVSHPILAGAELARVCGYWPTQEEFAAVVS